MNEGVLDCAKAPMLLHPPLMQAFDPVLHFIAQPTRIFFICHSTCWGNDGNNGDNGGSCNSDGDNNVVVVVAMMAAVAMAAVVVAMVGSGGSGGGGGGGGGGRGGGHLSGKCCRHVGNMSSRHKMSLQFWPDGSVSPTQDLRCRGLLCWLQRTLIFPAKTQVRM